MPSDFVAQLTQATAYLRSSDPILAPVIAASPLCGLRPHSDYFRALASSIIGQQLSVKAAATIRGRFAALSVGDFPTPQEVTALPPEQLRTAGLSLSKVAYIQDLARHVIDGRLDTAHLPQLPNEEIIIEVTGIKGIGEWTAQMFLIFCLGRLDVLPTGDLGIRRGMQILYGLQALPSPVDMMAVAERRRWTGYESVASWYVWRSLDLDVAI